MRKEGGMHGASQPVRIPAIGGLCISCATDMASKDINDSNATCSSVGEDGAKMVGAFAGR